MVFIGDILASEEEYLAGQGTLLMLKEILGHQLLEKQ